MYHTSATNQAHKTCLCGLWAYFLLFAKVRLYMGVAQPLWAMC
ncbi:hypothetical protein [Moraxella lacunata]|nr:hypothetical protein [Moraxella lacunata]